VRKVKNARKARGRGPETQNASKRSVQDQVEFALTWLKRRSTRATLEAMARYSIPSDHAYGVATKDIKALGKTLGRNQPLAVALWATGVYEARMLASFVGDPEQLTPAQMDRWCKDFDNWAFCDAMSFNLFDRTPHAWAKVAQWSTRRNEFEKRTAFALLWSLTVHDKCAGDELFEQGLALIEREAGGTPFCQEGHEHGPARDRQTQSRAQFRGRDGGAAPGEFEGRSGTVGGERCAPGTHECCCDETPQGLMSGLSP
jgi:3-methyladenine DNA glycosylase AlkD